jgi:enoyl-CoA hydratase
VNGAGVRTERDVPVTVITLDRPAVRNAIDPVTADALRRAFEDFEADPEAAVAVLTGEGGTFCAGADLTAFARGAAFDITPAGPGPLGPTRMAFQKPVIAAIAGHAVAGGLELALMCDLRVCDTTAVFGVFCRRWGVPLIDGGTWRLPRLVGVSRALDLVLTGRAVTAEEAFAIGLANRVVPAGGALDAARALAHELARLPQACLQADRAAVYANLDASPQQAFEREVLGAAHLLEEARRHARRFAGGAGRHGQGANEADSVPGPSARATPGRDPD